MGEFKHHSYFDKEKNIQNYLVPHICVSCRKSFKKPVSDEARKCPDCGEKLIEMSRKFKSPKKSESDKWEVVKFLADSGFRYHSLYSANGSAVKYPQTMKEAKSFAEAYKGKAKS